MEMYAFVYHQTFDRTALDLMRDDDFMELEATLEPAARRSYSIGTSGARKMRIGLAGRGEARRMAQQSTSLLRLRTRFMLLCYPKNVQGKLTEPQRKALRAIIAAIRKEYQL